MQHYTAHSKGLSYKMFLTIWNLGHSWDKFVSMRQNLMGTGK